MDKIRKIAKWLWVNKERMVLIIMVGVLVYRVNKVIYPDLRPDVDPPKAPVESWVGVPPDRLKIIRPPIPPVPPTIDIKESYTNLGLRNPFWLHAKGTTSSTTGEIRPEDLGITLHNIRENQGSLTAQISTQTGGKRWRRLNAQFEQFELVDINDAEQTVTIYADQHRKEFTFSKT